MAQYSPAPNPRQGMPGSQQVTTPPLHTADQPAMGSGALLLGVSSRKPGEFDIVATYHTLLRSDPDLTMPVAAIEALVALLAATPSLNTISETLDLLNSASSTLKRAVPNPISLSAGTDLFTRYIVTSLRPGPSSGGMGGSNSSPHASTILLARDGTTGSDFHAVRSHLLANGRLFAQRAKAARERIANLAAPFIRPHTTILTNGGSRVVGAVLRQAAKSQTLHNGSPRFRVIWVTAPASLGLSTHRDGLAAKAAEGANTIRELRRMQVPVAEISEAAVAYVMEEVSMALVGAEGVVETGGVISRLGTYQLCTLARNKGRSVYVVVESHKFVRSFPLGEMDLGVEQRVLEFRTETEDSDVGQSSAVETRGDLTPTATRQDARDAYFGSGGGAATTTAAAAAEGGGGEEGATGARGGADAGVKAGNGAPVRSAQALAPPEAVDYTPPNLITALVTEAGVLTPSAVSEELIRIWY